MDSVQARVEPLLLFSMDGYQLCTVVLASNHGLTLIPTRFYFISPRFGFHSFLRTLVHFADTYWLPVGLIYQANHTE